MDVRTGGVFVVRCSRIYVLNKNLPAFSKSSLIVLMWASFNDISTIALLSCASPSVIMRFITSVYNLKKGPCLLADPYIFVQTIINTILNFVKIKSLTLILKLKVKIQKTVLTCLSHKITFLFFSIYLST